LAGYGPNYATGSGSGITYHNVTGGTIQGCEVTGNELGIIIDGSDSITVSQNAISNSAGAIWSPGISIGQSSSIDVLDNFITGSQNSSISLWAVEEGSIVNNTISNNVEGIGLDACSGMTVSDNEITNSVLTGIGASNSGGITVSENTLSGNGGGIWYHNVTASSITGNSLTSNNGNGIGVVAGSSVITVSQNNVTDSMGGEWAAGISSGESTSINILDNTVTGSQNESIVVWSTEGGSIVNNVVSNGGGPGVASYDSIDVTSSFNSVTGTRLGIWYHNVSGTMIEGNEVTGCTEWGIGTVGYSEDLIITGNSVMDNLLGILVGEATNVTVYNNYLNNTDGNAGIDIPNSSAIAWNIELTPGTNIVGGSWIGGNYWAQPDGNGYSQVAVDANADGICDDPFELAPGIFDNYPLGGTPSSEIWAEFTATPSEGIVNGNAPLVVKFTDTSTGPIDTWLWNFDDGTTSSEQNPEHSFWDPRVYGVTLTVTNSGNGDSATAWLPIYVRPEVPGGVPIWPGWNFVSTPRTLADGHNTAQQVFGEVSMAGRNIMSYDASTKTWVALLGPEIITPLEGYWIYSDQVGPFVEYTYIAEFGPITPQVKHLEQGWNAIGMGSVYNLDAPHYLAPLGDSWSVLLEYDSGTQAYYFPQANGITTWSMNPGRGYWIYMQEPGDLLAVTG
jgi:parallel beta-helix repeat protein